jgi:hypothetical protein
MIRLPLNKRSLKKKESKGSVLIKKNLNQYGQATEIEVAPIKIIAQVVGTFEFPKKFYALPEVGDYVDSTCRNYLRVASRTYRLDGTIELVLLPFDHGTPP